MLGAAAAIDRDLRELGRRSGDAALLERLAVHGLELLDPLEAYLASDLPIAVLEGYEALLKRVLRQELAAGEVTGAAARRLAAFQLRVGLLLKYKSYAVKASSPLGYSIFLQNPAEGFSFQRHVSHKTEVFHILDVHPGGFVFLCSYQRWARIYERERFAAWLAGGGPDPDYDRCRFAAAPGDVFILDRLGVVHTVVGCILEEFATVSTDMVERLHDQNEGRTVPPELSRANVLERLHALRTPAASRLVAGPARRPRRTPLPPREIPGGERTVLADSFVTASLYRVAPRAETGLLLDPRRAVSLYVRSGLGRIAIGTPAELERIAAPGFAVAPTELLIVPPGIGYVLANEMGTPCEVVEHKIQPEIALV